MLDPTSLPADLVISLPFPMSKYVTLYIVDQCTLNDSQLGIVNDYLRKIILLHIYWARRTHQLGIAAGNGSGVIQTVVPANEVTEESYREFLPVKGVNAGSTNYEDILSGAEYIISYINKKKYQTKRIVFFGSEISSIETLQSELKARSIDIELVMPSTTLKNPTAVDGKYTDLDSYCGRYLPKIISPSTVYTGYLMLGHPKGNCIEIEVKCLAAVRITEAPHFKLAYGTEKPQAIVTTYSDYIKGEPLDTDVPLHKGYMYGNEVINIPQSLEKIIKEGDGYNDGAFEICSFVTYDPLMLTGEGSNIVMATTQESSQMLSALARAMKERKLVALARFASGRANSQVQMTFLEPFLVDGEPDRLLMTAVVFRDDYKQFIFSEFNKTPATVPTAAMNEAMDAVVDDLDIDNHFAYDGLQDFIVPQPRVERYVDYMIQKVEHPEREPTILVPEFPTCFADGVDLDVLGVQKIIETKPKQEEKDKGYIAQEQELDLDDLMG